MFFRRCYGNFYLTQNGTPYESVGYKLFQKVEGPMGPTGPMGPMGPTGLNGIGITGPKGDKGDVGLIGPQGEKGETGPIGPAGLKGDKGDKGDTGPAGEKGNKGDTGAVGEKGEKGEKGDKGDVGTTYNQNATILNMASQQLTLGTPLTLSTILTNNGLIVSGTAITVPATGTYIVAFYINRSNGAAGTDGVAIAIDDKVDSYTSRPLSDDSTSSGYFVMNLDEGNAISIVPVIINATRINASGGPSATLTVIRIA